MTTDDPNITPKRQNTRWFKSRSLDRFDERTAEWMERWGHSAHRWALGLYFIWLGMLKVLGQKSATSIIADTIYAGAPEVTVPILGAWEVCIGICLCFRPLIRLALLLLAIRLPGTILAFFMHPNVCFESIPLVPTIQGQYLIKDAILFAAAMVIGGTVRDEQRDSSSKKV